MSYFQSLATDASIHYLNLLSEISELTEKESTALKQSYSYQTKKMLSSATLAVMANKLQGYIEGIRELQTRLEGCEQELEK